MDVCLEKKGNESSKNQDFVTKRDLVFQVLRYYSDAFV